MIMSGRTALAVGLVLIIIAVASYFIGETVQKESDEQRVDSGRMLDHRKEMGR